MIDTPLTPVGTIEDCVYRNYIDLDQPRDMLTIWLGERVPTIVVLQDASKAVIFSEEVQQRIKVLTNEHGRVFAVVHPCYPDEIVLVRQQA